jgi:hypothetical protein
MEIHLERFYTPFGVWGKLHMPSISLCAIERPWRDNALFVSCIPEGSYNCTRYSSEKYPDTFIVGDVPGRSSILFHKANTIDDLQGCIGVGKSFAIKQNKLWIQASADGFNDFMAELANVDEFNLTITTYRPEYP